VFSRFHAEAALRLSIASRRLSLRPVGRDIDLYAMLSAVAPSPLNIMNQAVASPSARPDEGLRLLQDSLRQVGFQLVPVGRRGERSVPTRGQLGGRAAARGPALAKAPTEAVRDLLRRRLTTPV